MGVTSDEKNEWMVYVTTKGDNMLAGKRKMWNEFRKAYVKLGVASYLAGKYHPQVEWAFKRASGLAFPVSEEDQLAFITIAESIEVDGKTFECRKAADAPGGNVKLALRVPSYAADVVSQQAWMQILPVAIRLKKPDRLAGRPNSK